MTTTLKDRVRAAATEQRATGRTFGPAAEAPAVEVRDEMVAADKAAEWLQNYEHHVTAALPAHVDAGAFLAAVRGVLPDLIRCRPASVLMAVVTAARFGLVPDGRHAVILADAGLATFVPMYQGYVDLMYRSGHVESVHVGLIYEGDEWEYTPTAPAPLDFTHKPRPHLPRAERGEPILAYSFCWLKGGARSQVAMLSREDAEEIRDNWSKQYQRAQESGANDSTWHTDFDAMWRKSAIRRMAKLVPMSPELVALGAADNAGEDGAPQVLHAPDPESAGLLAEAMQAATAAEASQEQHARLPVKRNRGGRSKPKRVRGGARSGRRAS